MQNKQQPPNYTNAYHPKTCWQRINPFKRRPHYTLLPDRTIISNMPDLEVSNNAISTAKYHAASFLLFNLIQQFSKPANFYFFVICLLQLVPQISISEGKPTMALPLLVVVLISMVKDFVQDLKRHRSDRQQNNRMINVLGALSFSQKKSKHIRIGDIIKVQKNQFLPCDILLLQHDRNSQFVYVQTMNLDGQTSLKRKTRHPDSKIDVQNLNPSQLYDSKLQIHYQKPNPNLYSFNGYAQLREDNKNSSKLFFDNSNLLLRGSCLRINQFAVGLVLYTGHQTKVMLNSTNSIPKQSNLEVRMNIYFKITFISQFVLTFCCSLVYAIINIVNNQYLSYLQTASVFGTNLIFTWGTWFIIFASFVPISLLVTLQLIRFFQGIMISCSVDKLAAAQVQSSNLNQQLGQIQYVLSDKTGTLTKNIMNFKYAYINDRVYGRQRCPVVQGYPKVKNVDFADRNIFDRIDTPDVTKYLLLLSLCHNVLAQKQKQQYNASSPDQLSFVSFAKFCGFKFIGTKSGVMEVQFKQKIHQYKLVYSFEFTSDRKRMSVVLRTPQNKLIIFCKGADDVIKNRLIDNDNIKGKLLKTLNQFANQGLRTLVVAQKQIQQEAFSQWETRYIQALASMDSNRLDKIYALQSEMQKGLTLVGATAIQDKLQDNVAQTIKKLTQAGIVVWMLTGDRRQTAISIGHSTHLIYNSEKIILDCQAQNIQALLSNVQTMQTQNHLSDNRVLIVTGTTLLNLQPSILDRIIRFSMTCRSVICCRATPNQKEELTKQVMKYGRVLAIGDGANDVNMIVKSNVGVGIRGLQGSQAARAADYVVAEFQVLQKLLFFHGRELYRRNANVIIFNIYKNMLIILPLIWFAFVSSFSGSYIYDNWVFQMYNTLYTFFPIMCYSLLDNQLTPDESVQNVEYYKAGQTNKYFNLNVMLGSTLICVYESILYLVVVFAALQPSLIATGHMTFEAFEGSVVMTIVIVVCNIRPALFSFKINMAIILLSIIGIAMYLIVYIFVQYILHTDIANTLQWILSSAQFWILLPLCIIGSEGLYVFMRRFSDFNANAKGSNQQKIGQIVMQLQNVTGRQGLLNNQQFHQQSQQTPYIIEDSNKVYTGYAFDEDEGRQDKII